MNAQRTLIERGVRAVAGTGLGSLETSGGTVITIDPNAEARENCQRMEYLGAITGAPLLPFSLVHYSVGEDMVMRFDVSDYSGRRKLGILQEGAAKGDCPWVQYQGVSLLLWDLATLPAAWIGCATGALTGRRLGARMHSPYGQWDSNGPLLIVGASTATPPPYDDGSLVTLEPTLSLVCDTIKLDTPFATNVECAPVADVVVAGVEVVPPNAFGAAYRCWNLGSDFNVTDDGTGDVTI
jgi:hypothetical protein